MAQDETSTGAIFARLWETSEQGLTPTLARHLLTLRFSDIDIQRMHELAQKNRQGSLSKSETEELDNFVKVGDLLAILQSRARKRLKQKSTARSSHG